MGVEKTSHIFFFHPFIFFLLPLENSFFQSKSQCPCGSLVGKFYRFLCDSRLCDITCRVSLLITRCFSALSFCLAIGFQQSRPMQRSFEWSVLPPCLPVYRTSLSLLLICVLCPDIQLPLRASGLSQSVVAAVRWYRC